MPKTLKICQLASGSSITDLTDMLSPWGDYHLSYDCDDETDFIIGWSVTQLPKIKRCLSRFSHIPMINYNWDIYEWVWSTPREGEYDYKLYGDCLKKSVEVWCPSECTVRRMKQYFDLDNGIVIKSTIPTYDMKTSDGRYVLNSMRRLPDKNLDMFEKACQELNIPYKSTDHQFNLEEYREILANCSFQVVPYHEASTGGLSLMEGYYLGKKTLCSNSEWLGARDYIGDRAEYFQWDDIEDLKKKIKNWWENGVPKIEPDHKEFVVNNFSKKVIGKHMHDRLHSLYEQGHVNKRK